MSRSIVACLLLMGILLHLPHAGAQDKPPEKFDVVLEVAHGVGDKWRIAAVGSAHETGSLRLDQTEMPLDVKRRTEIVGELTVLTVGREGAITSFSLKVKRCQAVAAEKEIEICRENDVILVEWDKEEKTPRFTINEKLASALQAHHLRMVLKLNPPGAGSANTLLGSKTKRAVGEKWEIPSDPLTQHYALGGVMATPHNISATTSLVRAVGGDSLNGLEYRIDETVKDCAFHVPQNAGDVIASGRFSVSTVLKVPTVVPWANYETEQTSDVEVVIKSKNDNGKSIVIRNATKSTLTIRSDFIPR